MRSAAEGLELLRFTEMHGELSKRLSDYWCFAFAAKPV